MVYRLLRGTSTVTLFKTGGLFTALIFALLIVPPDGIAQNALSSSTPSATASSTPSSTKSDETPLTDRERALLDRIQKLEERLNAVEQKVTPAPGAAPVAATGTAANASELDLTPHVPPGPEVSPDTAAAAEPAAAAKPQDEANKTFGRYTPNFGFKLADTEYGDLSVSIFTYARYLNQKGLASTYTDAFGNVKNVQNRQDFQLNKMQIKFLGWIMTPKLRYFLYAWTSNANQGGGAQVVLAGNLNYSFNKHLTLSAGINGLPGTRSIEGNFPFWLSPDSRLIADEFFRGSYTSGVWAKGEITDKLRYQIMLGNNLSTLGVPATRLDNGINTVASALIWTPTTGEFGGGFGDFEDHQKLATRLAFHFSRSNESTESQPNSDQFENTQLRLSDGTVIFTPNIFGPGVAVTDARYRMTNVDGGLKYKGYALEGAYYWRWLDNFRGPGTAAIPTIHNHGYQIEASAMLIPKTLQVYTGHSRIYGDQGNPWDFRIGVNFFPWKNRVVRWNNEMLYLNRSPVGYTSVPFALGGKGWVFHSTWELAF